MRSFKTEGIIIKRKNYSEADRIVTVLSKYHGKLQFKASGVRKITSRRSAHIEPLNYALLTLHMGNVFPILTEAQSLSSYDDIKNDLSKVGSAYHICELVDGLCPEKEENRAIFELLKKTLDEMSYQSDLPLLVHAFEVELLTLLGYWQKDRVQSSSLDTEQFIENIIEKKLKSRRIFTKI